MKRRGGSGKPRIERRTTRSRARKVPTAHVSIAELREQLDRRTRERDEALQQQTATSEILNTINSSSTDITPVFDAILGNCVRLCGGDRAVIWQFDGHVLCLVGGKNTTHEAMTYLRQRPLELGSHNPTTLAGLERRIVHEVDVFANPAYRPLIPIRTSAPRAPTVLAVPLVRQDKLFGVITIWRHEKRLFTDKQVELVSNFATQAVIAIENTRLLNELRESLQQQTATADVLAVISSSPGELPAVFEAMLRNAVRICDAKFGNIYRWDGDALLMVATHNTPPAFAAARKSSPFRPGPETPTGRMVATKTATHVADRGPRLY